MLKRFSVIVLVAFACIFKAQVKTSSFFDIQLEIKKEYDGFTKGIKSLSPEEMKDTAKWSSYKNKWQEGYRDFEKRTDKYRAQLPGTLYPDFYFEDFNGKSYSLSDFNGQKIVLNFNYTFCDKCIKQIDSLLVMTGNKAKIIVLLHDTKQSADHIFEAYGNKVLLGFISLEYETYYTLQSGQSTTFLLEDNRGIRFFYKRTYSKTGDKELYEQLKLL